MSMKKLTLIFISTLMLTIACKNQSDKELQVQKVDSVTIDNRKMTFQKDTVISCYDFETGTTKELIQGFDPCISPDGKWLAYTEYRGANRGISLINIENLTKKNLNINNNNHYGAVWSPTGEYIAFSIMYSQWQIGLIKPDNSDFKVLTISTNDGLFAPTWSQDGKYIFAHSLRTLYKFDTNGKLIEEYDLMKMFNNVYYFSSSTKFLLASDNKTLIFDAGIDEYIEGFDEPLNAIFTYNIDTKQEKRISQKGVSAIDLWIDKFDKIYFTTFEKTSDKGKICQMSLNDTTLTTIMNNAARPSISYKMHIGQ